MSRTVEEYQAVVEELNDVCKKHGVIPFATCLTEGIHGEITLGDAASNTTKGWCVNPQNLDRTIWRSLEGDLIIQGLGELE